MENEKALSLHSKKTGIRMTRTVPPCAVKPKLGILSWIAFAVMSAGRLLVVLATLTLIHFFFSQIHR
jgi:hypothetical protein